MNKDYEKRMLVAFIISFVLIGVMWWNSRRNMQKPMEFQTNTTVVLTNIVNKTVETRPASPEQVAFRSSGKVQDYSLSWNGQINMQISTLGGRISGLSIDGDWNRYETSVPLLASNTVLPAGDLALGDTSQLMNYSGRPIYSLKSQTSNSLVLAARLDIKGHPVEIQRSYTLNSNYQLLEEISFRNLSSEVVNVDLNGKSFTVNSLFELVNMQEASPRNRIETYYDSANNKKEKALNLGLIDRIQGKKLEDTVTPDPKWMVMMDSYFLTAVIPQGQGWEGRFKQLYTAKKGSYQQISMSLEKAPFVLEKGESKTFSVKYYIGPRKEDLARKVDDSLKLVFNWGWMFNWLMKPIVWLMNFLIFLLGKVISNWGIVIILLALIIKLVLSPLSIKAAVSIKRMNLLQPKLKNLQEKYKDDQQKLQAKTMELYKKEGVNPLGGCLPMLLQIPVFFALYRVLSTSVELRGARFLWIKDLTQPDTLFMISSFQFNLLPLLMTAIQLVQTKLQSTNNPTMAQQNKLNTYMLPVMFLFLFWNMPAGLVLYWTIQNVYTIFEQFIINQDKYVKLK